MNYNRLIQLIGILALLLGVILMTGRQTAGPVLILVGSLVYAVARISNWLSK